MVSARTHRVRDRRSRAALCPERQSTDKDEDAIPGIHSPFTRRNE